MNWKLGLTIVGAVMGFFLIFAVFPMISIHNSAIRLEENINTDNANISKEDQRRVDLFNNLVDAIKSYNNYEGNTLEKITKARSQANSGKIENAKLNIQAVVEQYPQLKSQSNYKQAMQEFSITENRLASYRENYNEDIKQYNQYVRIFPNSFYLTITGYQDQHYSYLDFKVNDNQARNLFNN